MVAGFGGKATTERTIDRLRVCALLLVALGCMAGPARTLAAEAAAGNKIAATHVTVSGDEAAARVVVDLTAPVEVTAGVLTNPSRMTLDLPNVVFGAGAGASGKAAGLVSGYRYGVFLGGSSRIVLDLTAPARLAGVSTEPGPAGTRLVLRIEPTPLAEFETAARAGETQRMLDEARRAARDKAEAAAGGNAREPLVVIDPGHGGIDPGASNGKENEKDIVLAFGLLLREKLQAKHLRVAMTRSDDTFVPLGERVRFARDHGADFFISIHADTLSDGAGVRGATVYTNAVRASDASAARLAAKENSADLVAGIDSPDEQHDVADILIDLTRRETRQLSNRFAHLLVGDLRKSVVTNKNPLRSAGFRVLKAYDVPSVLLELGYLSNRDDFALMMSDKWRQSMTNAIADAIQRYFAARRLRRAGAGREADR